MDERLAAYQELSEKQRRDQLVVDNLGFVRRILGRLQVRTDSIVSQEDLESAGIVGLVEAAARYEFGSNADFKTFAYPRVRGAIFDELRRNCPLPQAVLRRWSRICRVIESHKGEATLDVIARLTGLTSRQVTSCFNAIRMTRPERWSEDIPIEDATTNGLDDEHNLEERRQILAGLIEHLSTRDRLILSLFHLEGLTLKEIAQIVDLSESRVSRILSQTELALRFRARSKINGETEHETKIRTS